MEQQFYLQDKRQYVGNDILWWAKDGKGYTTDVSEAEVFTKERALKQNACRPAIDIPWLKSYVDSKTRPVIDMQIACSSDSLEGTGIVLSKVPKPKREVHNCGHCGKFCDEHDWYTKVYNGDPCSRCEDDL